MQHIDSIRPASRNLERLLALAGAAACVVLTIGMWQVVSEQQPVWPLPALYFVEMVVVSGVALFAALRGDSIGGMTLWAAVGILLAFSFLGILSVGLFFLPITCIFAVVALLVDRREPRNLVLHLVICAIAAIAQAAFMLVAVGLLFT